LVVITSILPVVTPNCPASFDSVIAKYHTGTGIFRYPDREDESSLPQIPEWHAVEGEKDIVNQAAFDCGIAYILVVDRDQQWIASQSSR
jgi:hypothetical protein